MNCPDFDRLIDLARAEPVDEEMQVHLQSCASCRFGFQLVRELPAAFRPDIEVPERLVARVMAAVVEMENRQEPKGLVSVHSLMAGALGVATAVVVLGVSGSVGLGGFGKVLMYSLAVGLMSGLMEIRSGGNEVHGQI